ncbi:hypothetical protein JVT61DRAFT_13813 [Boletus reticuloceps]|uniref:YCII-related domain-containing protein n=1 Tax=Boletus reticuloceps TaxID=495285 RepID=A0A8I2YX15_9AGAM|nr:hypothetical protein JVT61DRAFT_13813 [Boletus reticuloceps]
MATNQDLPKFVVWAPDYAGAQETRLAIRPRHLENAHRLTKEGVIRVGGGVLTDSSANAAPADRKFFGSCLIIEAESLEAVRKIVESDVYYKEGVWDKEKLQILPMLLATSLPPVPSE